MDLNSLLWAGLRSPLGPREFSYVHKQVSYGPEVASYAPIKTSCGPEGVSKWNLTTLIDLKMYHMDLKRPIMELIKASHGPKEKGPFAHT